MAALTLLIIGGWVWFASRRQTARAAFLCGLAPLAAAVIIVCVAAL